MNILLTGRHCYPAGGFTSRGNRSNELATGGSGVVHDLLATGLGAMGEHRVFYHLERGLAEPLPPGVLPFDGSLDNFDVVHHANSKFVHESMVIKEAKERNIPFVVTCHIDPCGSDAGVERVVELPENWIYVSRTMALLAKSERYVVNGVNPSDFVYSENRGDFLLFLANLHSAEGKGLDTALELAQECGVELVVAGGSHVQESIDFWENKCKRLNIRFAGDVRGREKADLLAEARAFLFPTRLNEACPLVLLEALMSGCPLICSPEGACPEICSEDVGFICNTFEEYRLAIAGVERISPQACRAWALSRHHYRSMVEGYLRQYEMEVERVAVCEGGLR
jgi:glycosyltransferase involved in cell wall biosynthesis